MSESVSDLTRDEELIERLYRILSERQSIPKFADGKVPMSVAVRVTGKNAGWIQAGIIMGWFPVGNAVRNGQLVKSLDEIKPDSRIDYTILPKAFWEVTGYVWRGEKA